MEFGSDFYSLYNYWYIKHSALSLVQYNWVFKCLVADACIFYVSFPLLSCLAKLIH